MTIRPVSFRLNGRRVTVPAPPTETLAVILRDRLGLTGTKIGCDGGECGSCTVVIDGRSRSSCLVLAADLAGRRVTTIETSDRRIARLRAAFLRHDAFQCGFCTPGMILTASTLPPGADAAAVRTALAGNLCRCTGYQRIVDAVVDALADE